MSRRGHYIRLKSSLAGVALAASLSLGTAQAAIDDDGIDGGSGFGAGTGSGELFFQIWDMGRQLSLTWDFGLKISDFLADPLGSRSWSSAEITNFISGGDLADMQWNVGGMSNNTATDFSGVFLLTTVDPDASVEVENGGVRGLDGGVLEQALALASSYVRAVSAELGNNEIGTFGPSDGTAYYGGGAWGDSWGAQTPFDTAGEFEQGASEALSMLQIGLNAGDSNVAEFGAMNDAVSNVMWTLDPGGALSVQAVPVPAAVWLFGSALAGLMGLGRGNRT